MCWFSGDAALFVNAAKCQAIKEELKDLHPEIAQRWFHYARLFLSQKTHSLTPLKELKLLRALKKEIAKGYVHVQGKIDRASTPAIWAGAIDRILDVPTLDLPLPNHTYLAKIAWQMADEACRVAETQRNQRENTGAIVRQREAMGDVQVKGDPERMAFDLEKIPTKEEVQRMRKEALEGAKLVGRGDKFRYGEGGQS